MMYGSYMRRSFEEVVAMIEARKYQQLLPLDQLSKERANGRVFRGFREGQVCFAPTYKFDKGTSR
jgi:hypothetical protein